MSAFMVIPCPVLRVTYHHSYSTYLRGLDMFLTMYHLLDVTPLGRQEEAGNSLAAGENSWVRHHDKYGEA